MWWVLIIGKILSLFYYLLLIKYYCHFLYFQDQDFSWYFFDFILKNYEISVCKFFIVNQEVRIFIKNLFIIYINIFIWPVSVTFFEFCLIVIILSYFIYLLIIYSKSKKTKFSLIIMAFNLYIALFFFFQIFKFFTFLDFYYINIIFLINGFIIGVIYYIYFNINIFYIYIFKYKIKKSNRLKKIFFFKLYIYMFLLILLVNLIIISLNKISNNFVQEFIINFLLIYGFLYYKI